MTKEETVAYLKSFLDGDVAVGNIISLRTILESAIKHLSVEQLQGLDEAAIDFADNARKQLFTKDYAISSIADYDHGCIDGFKAGSEWTAEQGVTVEGKIGIYGVDCDKILDALLEKFKIGDKVIVQIRKKEE